MCVVIDMSHNFVCAKYMEGLSTVRVGRNVCVCECGLDTLQKLCRSGLVGIRDCVRYLAEYEGCVLVLVLVTDLGEDREIERCECCVAM